MASEQQHNAQAMFNLGYMHEQGLGMKKDWHLAKRCYDLAAETSNDAKVPVSLALMKLQLLFKFESFKEVIKNFMIQLQKQLKFNFFFQSPFSIILQLDENIVSNWDLYLITFLTVLLGLIIYLRQPRPGQEQEQAAQQEPEPQQAEEIIDNNGI